MLTSANWSKLRIYWRWITRLRIESRDDSAHQTAHRAFYMYSGALTRCDQLISFYIQVSHRERLTWPAALLFLMAVFCSSRYCMYLCVCAWNVAAALSWFSFCAQRSLVVNHDYCCHFLRLAHYIHIWITNLAAATASPHSGMQSRLAWCFPNVHPAAEEIESLKREFIMQPANKNAQGYTRSAAQSELGADSPLLLRFRVLMYVGARNHCL